MTGLLAYDELMWDNALASYRGERVSVQGRARAFVGEDVRRFGSPRHPCPKLALVPGGGCEAVLFHVPSTDRRYLLHNLKQREGRGTGRVAVRREGKRTRRVRCFQPGAAERVWPDAASVVEGLKGARGAVGTGAEYVRTVVHAMELWEIRDPLVEEVWSEVQGWTAGRWARDAV
ncbi:MAG: gamma-glutamylcyclotransferase [Gemmatimonadota bacterium]